LPDSLVQSTTAPPLHVGHTDDRGPISLAGPGPPSTLRRLWYWHWCKYSVEHFRHFIEDRRVICDALLLYSV